MRLSMFLVGLAATAAVACGGSDDNSGGGTAGKGGSAAAGTSSGGTSSTAGTGSGGGGSGSAAPGKVDSGAPDNTPASDLTDDQVAAFCDSLGKAAQDVIGADAKKATCGLAAYVATAFSGAMGAEAAMVCKSSYDECLAEPDETDEECTKPSDSCTATVGELEACMNDTLTQAKAALVGLPNCDDLGKEIELPAEGESPASCKVVEQKCPEALE